MTAPDTNQQLVPARAWGIGAGFLDHNVQCWLCEKNKAFYVGNPRWVFAPCMECQKRLAATNPEAWWPVVQDQKPSFWRGIWRMVGGRP